MTLVQNTFESGLADGTDVTVANSGGAAGDAFTTVAGTAMTYESTAAIRGSLGCLVNVAASATTYRAWQSVAGASTACAVRFGAYFPSFTVNAQSIANFRSSGGGTSLFHIMINASGTVSVLSDVASATLGTTAAALSANTPYRIEAGFTNPSTTTGTVTLRVYAWGTSTVVASLDLTGVNLGAAVTIGACRLGRPAAIGSAFTYRLDDAAFQTGSATLIGPSNVAPTASFTSSPSGLTVSVDGSGSSDSDGTIASYAWTFGDGGTGTGATASHTYAAGGTYTIGLTVTDNLGATGTTSSSVTVTAANVAPTASAGPDQPDVEPWATVTLTGTDADSDGTIATRAWAQTAGSPTVTLSGSGATRTFEAPATIAGTTLTFTYTATDNSGASTSDAMTVSVLPVTERAVIGGVEVPMQVRVS